MARSEAPKQYSREFIKTDPERMKVKEELAKEKTEGGKKLIETEEGKKQLAMKWIDKANLGKAGKAAVLSEIGVSEDTPAAQFIEKVAKWQEENGLAKPGTGDGVLGWKTLEAVDKKISSDHEAADSNVSEHGRLTDIDVDERETLAMKAKNDEIKTRVTRLGNKESYTDDNGNTYLRTDYADDSSIVTKTSKDGKNITYQDGDKYVGIKEYAKNHENTQWYKGEMEKLISQQKANRMSLLQTPEGNTLYVDKGGTKFFREISGKRETWNNKNGWEDPKIILAQENEKKRLEGLAVSTDPQDYYTNGNEPAEDPYKLAEIAKSKIPAAINDLGITRVANDIKLGRATTNERGISEVQNGSFFAFDGKGFQVIGLEKYSGPDGIFRIHLKPLDKRDPTVYSAEYLSQNKDKIQRYETQDTLLAALKKPTESVS